MTNHSETLILKTYPANRDLLMNSPTRFDSEAAWQAVQNRDPAVDGDFFFGVLTTGVYCRPSCPSRRPLRKNVRFYANAQLAEQDGLRACLRCRPSEDRTTDPAAPMVRRACRYLEEQSEAPPSLSDLAARSGLSPAHFQKTFKRLVGVSPKQYIDAVRIRKLKQNLKEDRGAQKGDITGAIYSTGFGSPSRVYEKTGSQLGMTPAQYRNGGRGVTITHVCTPTSLGQMLLGATDRGLCFLQFGDSPETLLRALRTEYPFATLTPLEQPFSSELQSWLDALHRYLEGSRTSLDLPLDLRASAFRLRVWNYLRTIPYGDVQSYSEVATGIGEPTATRAVASACAKNTVALLIPCHRVIRNNGELGGYRWGLDRKRRLLDTERAGRTTPGSEAVQ